MQDRLVSEEIANNKLARGAAAPVQASVESGGGAFRIENPLSSLTLQLKELKARAKLPGVKADAICQCTTPTLFLNDLELSKDVVAARRWACA